MNTSENQISLDIESAIESGRVNEVRALLAADKGRLAWTTPFGTWLHWAAMLGKLDVVKLLIEQGIEINRRASFADDAAINLAAGNGHAEVVQYLISQNAELDVSEPTRNPLFSAIVAGSYEIAKLLLEAGIDARVRYTGQRMKNMDAIGHAEERGEKEIATLIRDFLDKHPAETDRK